MKSRMNRSELRTRALPWVCWLAALLMAGEAAAGDLYPGRRIPAGDNPISMAVADLDGDSAPDLAIADAVGNAVRVLLGSGDGDFQTPVSYPAGDRPTSVAVADLDGDAVLDLVTAAQGEDPSSSGPGTPGGVSVLLGNGDGSFEATGSYPAGTRPWSVAVADFDTDGILDLVTTSPLDPM